MRAILLAGVLALVSAGLTGCDWFGVQGNRQAANTPCPCPPAPAPQAEPLARLAPPSYAQSTPARHRHRSRDSYTSYAETTESFEERSYSSASGEYVDAESGYGEDGGAYRAHRRGPPGGGYWIDGFNRAHYISRNAELEARNAANMAVNSGRMHSTWLGYDKDCPEAFGQDGY